MDGIKKQIIESYEQRGKSITENSVNKYIKDIITIRNLLGVQGEDNDISYLYNVDDVSAVIEDMRGRRVVDGAKVMASPNTKRNYYQSIVSVLDALADFTVIAGYQKLVNKYNKQYNKKLDESALSLSEESTQSLISFEDLNKVVMDLHLKVRDIKDKLKTKDDLTEADMNTFQTYCLLKLYMTYPARNEFATLLWGTDKYVDKKDNNYLILKTHSHAKVSQMIINVYKTSGLYDTRHLEFEKGSMLTGTLTMWRICLRRYLQQDDKQLKLWAGTNVFFSRFSNIDGDMWFNTAMTNNKLSKYFSRFFVQTVGKPLSTTSIAKIVNSHQNKEAADTIKLTGKARGTSVGTLSTVYTPVLPDSTSQTES